MKSMLELFIKLNGLHFSGEFYYSNETFVDMKSKLIAESLNSTPSIHNQKHSKYSTMWNIFVVSEY